MRTGKMTLSDLQLLESYKLSFQEAYTSVISSLRTNLQLEPTGRFPKTTPSIGYKLLREKIRLTQIQDIAGCRVVVDSAEEQDAVVERLSVSFSCGAIHDRREKSSHGYRAVHVIVRELDKNVEIQVRTRLQQLWAEFSEKLSDKDPGIKYGKGQNTDLQEALLAMSDIIRRYEETHFSNNEIAIGQREDLIKILTTIFMIND